MVHGGCGSEGCYAMGDEAIEKIYIIVESALTNGQDGFWVHCFPFRLSDENLLAHGDS